MNKLSRRSLAHWAADQLIAGRPLSKTAEYLAAVLTQTKMTDQAGFLISDITWELEQRQALAVGKVTSANPLSKQLAAALRAHIQKLTNAKTVTLEEHIDKSVIGGIRIETASQSWDQTVAHKLAELREVF